MYITFLRTKLPILLEEINCLYLYAKIDGLINSLMHNVVKHNGAPPHYASTNLLNDVFKSMD